MKYRTEIIKTVLYKGKTIEFTQCADTWEAWVKDYETDTEPSYLRIGDDFEFALDKAQTVIDEILEMQAEAVKQELKQTKQQARAAKPLHSWLRSR